MLGWNQVLLVSFLVSCGCHRNYHTWRDLKWQKYSLVPEAKCLKPRCGQGRASCVPRPLGAASGVWCGHAALISASAITGPPPPSMSPRLHLLRTTAGGFKACQDDLISRFFLVSARTLFLSKVALTHRCGLWDMDIWTHSTSQGRTTPPTQRP